MLPPPPPLYAEVVHVERSWVIAAANRYLGEDPRTVTADQCPRSPGGPHDFYSEGDYWWPDPKDPGGPYIRRDGETNPDNFVAHRKDLIRLSIQSAALASAYLLTSDKRYADKACEHFRAWFVDPATRMNPNLRYGQAIKGVCTGRGIGIIDTVHLVDVALSVRALERRHAIPEREAIAINAWFRAYLTWMTTSAFGHAERDNGNNHSDAWALQVSAFALLIGDKAELTRMRRMFKDTILPEQVARDGRLPKELKRTKPYGYCLFTTDLLADLAQLLSTPRDDLWNYQTPDGRSLRSVADFIYPYVRNKKAWKWRHDVQYWNDWPVRQTFLLFAGAAYHRPDYIALWKRLNPQPAIFEVLRNYPVRQPILWFSD